MADKKLFEQTLQESPTDLTQRLAFGKAGVATKNITLSGLITWLENRLGFLKKSNNLNDLQSTATARNNLNVYSKTEVYTKTEINNIVNPINNKFNGLAVAGMWSINWNGSAYIAEQLSNGSSLPSFVVTRQSTGTIRISHGNGYAYIAFAQAFGGDRNIYVSCITYFNGYIEVNLRVDNNSGIDGNFHIIFFSLWN